MWSRPSDLTIPAIKLYFKMRLLYRHYYCSFIPQLIFLATLILSVLAADVYFEDEDGAYLMREHCLSKPYHGENNNHPTQFIACLAQTSYMSRPL